MFHLKCINTFYHNNAMTNEFIYSRYIGVVMCINIKLELTESKYYSSIAQFVYYYTAAAVDVNRMFCNET